MKPRYFLFALLAQAGLTGCTGTQHQLESQAQPWAVGQAVRLNGTYAGWRGTCAGPPPVTRADWMLNTVQGCIYIQGSISPGPSARPEAPDGRAVTVEGTIRLDRNGRKYVSPE